MTDISDPQMGETAPPRRTATTRQAEYWSGPDGDQYHDRQEVPVDSNMEFFARVFTRCEAQSFLEFGCGAGLNLEALSIWDMGPDLVLTGLEINPRAAERARHWGEVDVVDITEPLADPRQAEVTFTKGVLIHVPDDRLKQAAQNLVDCSTQWIMVAEYYSPTPREIRYRDQDGLCWARDYAGLIKAVDPTLQLVDYGFHSRYDEHPQDDITWFLFKKRQ